MEQEWQGKQPRSGYKERLDMDAHPGKDRIRGSVDLPLTREGAKQVFMLGIYVRRKGGFDRIVTSNLQRTMDTATAIAVKHDGKQAPIRSTPALRDMNYGEFEGLLTSEAIHDINKYITDKPDEKVPGGESFNQYAERMLQQIGEILDKHKDEKVAVVVNRRSIKTIEAWLMTGKQEVDKKKAIEWSANEDTAPGSVFRIEGDKVVPVDVKVKGELTPGVYLIRHGKTAWNGESK